MAQCPKCGKKLKLTDISQFCPACGVNMRFVNFEENFYNEAKIAELSQANMHVKIKHLKASYIGSRLTIARLVVMLFPLIGLLVTSGSFTLTLPYKSATYQFGVLGVVNLLMEGGGFSTEGLMYLFGMSGSQIDAAAFSALRAAVCSFVAVLLIAVLILFVSLLCFISYKNMQKINVVLAGLGIITSVAVAVLIGRFVSAAQNSVMLSGKNGYGFIVYILTFAAVLVVNLLLWIKGIPVVYDEGMEERAEIYKKVKAGEIDIDTLPQPIVETEETRKIDEEIAKEEEAYQKKHAKEDSADGEG